ncbi:MAG: Carboxymuconolactone decarboxylase family protein [Conexibacter sp.]|jgi:alkylhydroperoxidase/carboxymuconolactone decarboxylase family protein YurZ|nr:Carboxymuconolactone decarboxylase family protein [Conexibacter sp.]
MSNSEVDRRSLRHAFVDQRGYWNPFWEGMLELDPAFFEAYLNFSSVPWKSGTLEPKVKELIYIAIDASTTHLYEPGLRQHIKNALGYGATREEIMEVYELTSVLGIHTCTLGVPVLLEELDLAGAPPLPPMTAEQEQVRDDFVAKRGYWNPFWEGLLRMDTTFFQAYLTLSGVPWENGTLEPKIKELIYVAIDAATTHLYEPGLRQHIKNALGYGATREEIMEVYELTSVLGIHTCTLGVPVLLEELELAQQSR